MGVNDFLFPRDIYLKHLTLIQDIHFTPREIDVIACILHGRGTSKIASFLSLSPNTVFVHTRNITIKLGCNSRESIIDFVEKSKKLSILREYYSLLVIEFEFEKTLTSLAKLKRQESLKDALVCFDNPQLKNAFLSHLTMNLKQAGIFAETRDQIESHRLDVSKGIGKCLFLLVKKGEFQEIPPELSSFHFIDLTEQTDYYLSIFEFLRKLLPGINLENTIAPFIQQYEPMAPSEEMQAPSLIQKLKTNTKNPHFKIAPVFKERKWFFRSLLFFA